MSTELAGKGNYDAYAGNAQVIAKGARKLSDIQSARKVLQVDHEMVSIQANVTPFIAFMEKLKKNKDVAQANYYTLLKDILPQTVTYGTATGETTGITLTLASGQGNSLVVGDILFVERTREVILVVGISADTLTVTRAFGTGSGAAATINDAEELQIQGSAFAENSAAPSGISSEPNMIQNYCQTFRQSVELSGRDEMSENYGGDEYARLVKDAKEAIDIKIEKAFMFNEAYYASDPTMTKGLLGWISTNSTNQAGVLDEVSLATYNRGFQRHNVGRAKDCITFCGDNVRTALDAFGRDALRLRPADDMLGVKIQSWQSSFGELKFMQHALMSPLGSSQTAANRGRIGMMISVNTQLVGKRTFKGRGMKFSKNIEVPGTDGTKSGWTADVGLAVYSEKSMALMYGVTG